MLRHNLEIPFTQAEVVKRVVDSNLEDIQSFSLLSGKILGHNGATYFFSSVGIHPPVEVGELLSKGRKSRFYQYGDRSILLMSRTAKGFTLEAIKIH